MSWPAATSLARRESLAREREVYLLARTQTPPVDARGRSTRDDHGPEEGGRQGDAASAGGSAQLARAPSGQERSPTTIDIIPEMQEKR